MAIPPPPPAPGPPPPPIGNLKLGAPAFGKSSGGADPRSALLLSIQKGTKLKKTTTIDKSEPLGAGRVADANNSSSNARTNSSGAPTRPPPPNNGSSAQLNGTPKLKGIFEGLPSMPKLKPVGGRTIGVTSPTNESPSSTSTGSGSPQNSNGIGVEFTTELSKRIAMKKQMKSSGSNAISEINARNRGPPPQPPSKIVTDNINSSTTVNSSPLIKQSNSGLPTSVSSIGSNGLNISSILPNKSSLFGNSNSLNSTSTKTTTPPPITTTTTKVVPNYGKPTCAPKPPVTAKNGLSPLNNISNTTNNGNSSNRSIVSRAQSMRAPRSPPISVAGSTFPAAQQFGTIRGIPAAFQSQDAINSVSIRPAPTISRPTVAPPRPPIEAKLAAAAIVKEQSHRTFQPEKRSQGRCKSPPPPPIRSISNTNLPTLPLSIPPSAMLPNLSNISNSSTNNFGGSASNVSTLVNNVMLTTNTGSANNLSVAKDRSPNTSTNSIAPPLPPHRTCPAPPPPIRQTSIAPSSNSGVAPPVPQRHSSIRNSNGGQVTAVVQHQTIATSVTSNSTRTVVNRFVVELETKFGHSFHNVTEFPAPQPFTKFEKSYPSRNMSKATTENRKAKAPSPPSVKTINTATPTNEKYQLQLTEDDKHLAEESSYC